MNLVGAGGDKPGQSGVGCSNEAGGGDHGRNSAVPLALLDPDVGHASPVSSFEKNSNAVFVFVCWSPVVSIPWLWSSERV